MVAHGAAGAAADWRLGPECARVAARRTRRRHHAPSYRSHDRRGVGAAAAHVVGPAHEARSAGGGAGLSTRAAGLAQKIWAWRGSSGSRAVIILVRRSACCCGVGHLAAPQKTLMAIAPRTPLELLLWIGLSVSAGFCEEFVFRGYFLRQFSSVGAGVWLGVVCSSLLFGVSHGYEGAAGMIAITAYGALFCVLALAAQQSSTGNDRACVARHFQRSDARAAATFPSVLNMLCADSARARCEKKVVAEKLNFFLDTVCAELYTFVNCSILCCRLRCSTSKRENRNHGNEKGS